MSKEKKVAVTFKKPWRGYNIGETAAFDEETAQRLAESKYVEEVAQTKARRGTADKSDKGGKADGSALADQQAGGEKPSPDAGKPEDDERP